LLRGVEYHADTGLASLLPGTDWQSIYDYLDSIGKSVAGGRQGEVGVAGFLLGGGLSLYLYRDGMSCDSIRQLEVVLANGTVVEANANQHADLFKALKGGSSNFGIVTRFDMEAFDIRPIWRNTKIYAEDATPLVLGALSRWADNIGGYQNGSAVVAWTYSPANGEIRINSNMHDVSGVEAHPVYEELSSIPGQLTNIVEFTNISTIAKDNLPRGYKYVSITLTSQ
jgi:FAD/FMN-containing dehydrogenase